MADEAQNVPDPVRFLEDLTPCWCVETMEEGHTPKCVTHRSFAGVKGLPQWLQVSMRERTNALQLAFLEQYRTWGIIGTACTLAGVNRDTIDNWRKADPSFGERMAAAKLEAADTAEQELRRRAIIGWDEPVYQAGNNVGTIRKFSDRLLELHIKALKPTEYRENVRLEASGPNGGPIETTALPAMEDHERATLRRILEAAIAEATEREQSLTEAPETPA